METTLSFRRNTLGLAAGLVTLIASASQASAQDTTTRMLNFLAAGTDGNVGFYLKEVNGPVLANSAENFAFYPASTIKVLEHLHAMRDVEAMNSDLDATMVQVCPSTGVCTGCNPECPAPSAMDNFNCSDNPNNMANCGAAAVQMSLRCAIQRMMYISDNQATNSLQDFFGGGDASVGRTAMNNTGNNVVGMSLSTALQHKFACGNIANNPFNTSTAQDLALIYEQVATNPAVLDPTTLPTFRALMDNETNDGLLGNLQTVANQEANLLDGMSQADPDVVAFNNAIRFYQKGGNIGTGIASIAGLVELPAVEACTSVTKRYVFALYIDMATNNSFGSNLRPVAAELLRDVISEALDTIRCDRPPELTLPAPVVLECNEQGGIDGADPQVMSWLAEGAAEDLCSEPDLANDAPGFFPADCGNGATTDVTFTASDECDNTSEESSSITVADTTAPEITVPDPITLECNAEGGVPANDPDIVAWLAEGSATDICGGADLSNDAPALFPAGCGAGAETLVTFSSADDCNNQSQKASSVSVTDTTAPDVNCAVANSLLWPPNHKLVDVGLSVQVSDVCEAEPTVQVSVTSDESPSDEAGSGGAIHCPDAVVADQSVQLRAERSGPGDGRVYTITVTATDGCGNQGVCQVEVGVPHDSKSAPVKSGSSFDATVCGG